MVRMSFSYVFNKPGVQKGDAFDSYLRQAFPYYAGNSYAFDTGDLTVYSTLDINQAREASLAQAILAYVDPAVYYNLQFTKTYSVPSETVVDGTDSGDFTPVAQFLVQNGNDGNVVNKLVLIFKTEDIGESSQFVEPAVTAVVKDLSNGVEVASTSFRPEGIVTSDGGTLTTVVITDIADFFPTESAVWEVSVSITGDVSVKLAVGQYFYYSVE